MQKINYKKKTTDRIGTPDLNQKKETADKTLKQADDMIFTVCSYKDGTSYTEGTFCIKTVDISDGIETPNLKQKEEATDINTAYQTHKVEIVCSHNHPNENKEDVFHEKKTCNYNN